MGCGASTRIRQSTIVETEQPIGRRPSSRLLCRLDDSIHVMLRRAGNEAKEYKPRTIHPMLLLIPIATNVPDTTGDGATAAVDTATNNNTVVISLSNNK